MQARFAQIHNLVCACSSAEANRNITTLRYDSHFNLLELSVFTN